MFPFLHRYFAHGHIISSRHAYLMTPAPHGYTVQFPSFCNCLAGANRAVIFAQDPYHHPHQLRTVRKAPTAPSAMMAQHGPHQMGSSSLSAAPFRCSSEPGFKGLVLETNIRLKPPHDTMVRCCSPRHRQRAVAQHLQLPMGCCRSLQLLVAAPASPDSRVTFRSHISSLRTTTERWLTHASLRHQQQVAAQHRPRPLGSRCLSSSSLQLKQTWIQGSISETTRLFGCTDHLAGPVSPQTRAASRRERS
jgi:hypothetical protein